MPRTLLLLLMVPPWIGALYGTLQIHSMDLHLGPHTICGPWGCGPRPEALIGYHGFWAVVILPVAITVGVVAPRQANRLIGGLLLIASVIGAATYLTWDGVQYASSAQSTEHAFQRAVFTLVTTVDIPMIQALIASGLLWGVFGRKAGVTEPAEEQDDNTDQAASSVEEAVSVSADVEAQANLVIQWTLKSATRRFRLGHLSPPRTSGASDAAYPSPDAAGFDRPTD